MEFSFRNSARVQGLGEEDEELLLQLIIDNPRNTRERLIRYTDSEGNTGIHRVEKVSRHLKLYGATTHNLRKEVTYEMTDSFKNLVFISPFYFAKQYKIFAKVSKMNFNLPPNMPYYLKRKAKRAGENITGENWFRRRNSRIDNLLEALDMFDRETIVRKFISPIDGVATPDIGIDWSGIK